MRKIAGNAARTPFYSSCKVPSLFGFKTTMGYNYKISFDINM